MRAFFILGTAAELIKMFPVIQAWHDHGHEYYVWNTGQSRANFWKQYDEFGFSRDRAFCLDGRAEDLSSRFQAMLWFARTFLISSSRLRRELKALIATEPRAEDLAFVHGDTLSTVMGCRFARKLQMPIVHVEAGMRSGTWLEPFPEEINRRLTSRWAAYHFAPDEFAAQNLRTEGRSGRIVTTGGNTVLDALKVALRLPSPEGLPVGPYAVANLHRFENLHNDSKWRQTLDVLCQSQTRMPTYFVMHPPTRARLEADPEGARKLETAGVTLLDRMGYVRYAHLMKGAAYLITDSGSNQQESSYLGTPCLLLRENTESREGLGANVILSKFDPAAISQFLASPEIFRRAETFPEQGPTDRILTELQA